MYLAWAMTGRSLPELGRRFGGRDHTTVLYTARKIAALMTTDTAMASSVEKTAAKCVEPMRRLGTKLSVIPLNAPRLARILRQSGDPWDIV